MSRQALPLLWLALVAPLSQVTAAETTKDPPPLSPDPRRIAAGLYLDTPVAAETIERSLEILAALRCRYGLIGGVRDDEEAARRAFEEIEALEFSPEEVARMARRVGLSLEPASCGDACENFGRIVDLRLRMEALERLAATARCAAPDAASVGAKTDGSPQLGSSGSRRETQRRAP